MTPVPRVTWLGHATALIEMNGVRIVTDPVLRNRIGFIGRRSADVDTSRLRDVDAVLISHMHHDHLDLPSLRRFGRDVRIIGPSGCAEMLRREGFRRVEQLRAGEYTAVDSVCVGATFADHDGTRAPFGPDADALGFVLHGEATVYFAGDTDIFPEMSMLAGQLDLALLPVWGWGPTLGEGHLDPERAAESLQLLRPRAAMPIHWGTFAPLWLNWSQPSYLHEPPRRFAHYASAYAPEVDVRVVQPGGGLTLVH